MNHFYALILAGGGGTRLWPLSIKSKPKQMLPLTSDQTMFQVAINRLLPILPPERIFVVTGRQYVDVLRDSAPQLPTANFITEPIGLDSAPAIALALAHIHHADPDALLAIVTADHHIADEDQFRQALLASYELASRGKVVTLGIHPTFAATGFGYIQRGVKQDTVDGFETFAAVRFTEKPNVASAERFLASRQYVWNSGMFIWSTEVAMDEFKAQQGAIHVLMQNLMASIGTPEYQEMLDTMWKRMPKISIDYAIMENARNVAVIPVDIGWSDVGTWASVADILPKDGLGNCIRGARSDQYVPISAANNFIQSDRLVAIIGVEDLIVIETEKVLLICHKERTQDVKDVVQHLGESGGSEYL